MKLTTKKQKTTTKTRTTLATLVAVAVLAGCNGMAGGGGARRSVAASAWTARAAGDLAGGRAGHAQVALADGRLAVFGGRTANQPATGEIAVLDPAAMTFVPAQTRLVDARTGAAAVALPDGDVLVIGGRDANGKALATTEIWSPTKDAIRPGPDLGAPRADAAALVLGDSVLVFGGARSEPGRLVERWRIGASAFETDGTSLAEARGAVSALAIEDRTFLVVGGGASAGEIVRVGARGRFVASATGVRSGVALARVGGLVLALGGALGDQPVTFVDELALEAFVATTVRLPEARAYAASATLPDGRVLLVGGRSSGDPLATSVLVARTDLPASKGETVSRGPVLLTARTEPRATALADGRIVVTGGLDARGVPVAECEVLVPSTTTSDPALRAIAPIVPAAPITSAAPKVAPVIVTTAPAVPATAAPSAPPMATSTSTSTSASGSGSGTSSSTPVVGTPIAPTTTATSAPASRTWDSYVTFGESTLYRQGATYGWQPTPRTPLRLIADGESVNAENYGEIKNDGGRLRAWAQGNGAYLGDVTVFLAWKPWSP